MIAILDSLAASAAIGGDPGALESAALACEQAATDAADVADGIGSRSRELGSVWTGIAADGAQGAITALSARARAGSEVVSAVGPILRTYAAQLRAAQAAYAAASSQSIDAAGAVTSAAAAQRAANALPDTDPTRSAAQQAATLAAGSAAAMVSAAEGTLSAALTAAAEANAAAAAAVDALTPLLETMDATTTRPSTSGHGDHTGQGGQGGDHSWWQDAWHGVEDVAQDAWGEVESVADYYAEQPLAAARTALDAGLTAFGALTFVDGAAEEGIGIVADATGVGAPVGIVLNAAGLIEMGIGGTAAVVGGTRLTDDIRTMMHETDPVRGSDSSVNEGAVSSGPRNLSEMDPPDTTDSPNAHLYRDYDPYGGLSRSDFNAKYWDPAANGGAGAWRYPDNKGFLGNPAPNTLKPGDLLDRFGDPEGEYASPLDTPFAERSLPPSSVEYKYGTYEILKPLPPDVEQGPIVSAFEQPGGGLQFYFPGGLQRYIDEGYIRVLSGMD